MEYVSHVTISSNVNSKMGNSAFAECYGLISMTINSNEAINGINGNYSIFSNCNRLVELHYNGYSYDANELSIMFGNNGALQFWDYGFNNCEYAGRILINDNTKVAKIDSYGLMYVLNVDNSDPNNTNSFYKVIGYRGTNGEMEIPLTFNYKSVKEIAPYAFEMYDNLIKLTFKKESGKTRVTRIGNRAFWHCYNLTSIDIPSGVTTIGEYAFAFCYDLSNISIPSTVTTLNAAVFRGTAITSYVIPSGVTTIESSVFEGCSELLTVTIPASVTSIGSDAFSGCVKLLEIVDLRSTTMSPGDYGSPSTVNVVKTSSIITYGDYILYSLGNNTYSIVDYIGTETSLTLPSTYNGGTIVSIGYKAFYDNDYITSVIISSSITTIEHFAFYECDNITSVEFENPEGWWCAYNADDTSGTSVTLTDVATAATYLSKQYVAHYWKK